MRSLSLVLILLFLTACGDLEAPPTGDAVFPDTPRYEYAAYDPDQFPGRQALLFFGDPTDPFSRGTNAFLETLYESGEVSVSTYRVDFRSSTGARLKYGVVTVDTIVLVSASGERLQSIIHPETTELSALVQGGLPSFSLPSSPSS